MKKNYSDSKFMFHILKRYKSNIKFLCNYIKILPNDIKLNILGLR